MSMQIEHSQIVSALTRATQIWNVLSSHHVPLGRYGVVLGYTFPVLIHLPKVVLRVGVTLFR